MWISYKSKWIKYVSLLNLISVCLFVSIKIYSLIIYNFTYVRNIHELTWCGPMGPVPTTNILLVWGVPRSRHSSTCTLYDFAVTPDLAVIATWLNGAVVENSLIKKITPPERADAFTWRNANLIQSERSPKGVNDETIARFIANLAIMAWRGHHSNLTIHLIRSALLQAHTVPILETLISGLNWQTTDDEDALTLVYQTMIETVPDEIIIYQAWYENMVTHGAWASAQQACSALHHVQSLGLHPLTLTCKARLRFYNNDYAGAYADLAPLANRNDPVVLTWLGLSVKVQGEYEEAEKIFSWAINLTTNPKELMNLYWHLGDCQRALDRPKLAYSSYQKALQYDQEYEYQDELMQIITQLQ